MPPTFSQVESHPLFPTLTYSQQQALWERVIRDQPQFSTLNPEQQGVLIDKARSREPVFENPQKMQALMQDKEGSRVLSLLGEYGRSHNRMVTMLRPVAWVTKKLSERTGNEALGQYWDVVFSKDAEKFSDYLRETTPGAKAAAGLGTVKGLTADLAMWMVGTPQLGQAFSTATGGTKLQALRSLRKTPDYVLGEIGTRILKENLIPALAKHSHLGRTILAHGGAMGLYGATRSAIRDALDGDNETTKEYLTNMAKSFGWWAAGDMLFWTAAAVLPIWGTNAWRSIFGTAKKGGSVKDLTVADLRSTIDTFASGANLPPAMVQNLPKETKQVVEQAFQMHHLLKNVPNIVPGSEADLMRIWWENGFALKRVSPDVFKLRPILQPEDVIELTPDEVEYATGEIILDPKTTLDDPAIKETMASNWRELVNSGQANQPTPSVLLQANRLEELPKVKDAEVRRIVQIISSDRMASRVPIDPTQGSIKETQAVSNSMAARAYLHALDQAGEHPSFGQVLEAVEVMRDAGALPLAGSIAQAPLIEAWWLISPDKEAINAYKHYSQGVEKFNGLWDKVHVPYREMGQIPEQLGAPKVSIPLSERRYATPQEASEIVEKQGGMEVGWVASDEARQQVFEAGRRPVPMSEVVLEKGGNDAVLLQNNEASFVNYQDALKTVAEKGQGRDAAKALLRAIGYDTFREKDGSIVVLNPSIYKFISDKVVPITGKFSVTHQPPDTETLGLKAAMGGEVRFRRNIAATVSPGYKWPIDLMMRSLYRPDNKLTPDRVRTFVKQYVRQHPAFEEDPKLADKVLEQFSVHTVDVEGQEINIAPRQPFSVEVPATLTTDIERTRTLHDIVKGIEETIGSLSSAEVEPGTAARRVTQAVTKEARRNRYLPAGFLDHIVKRKLGGVATKVGDRFVVQVGGEQTSYPDLDSYAEAVVRMTMNPYVLKRQLKGFGLSLRGKGGDWKVLGPTAKRGRYKVLVQADSFEGLLDALEGSDIGWHAVMPESMGPSNAFINETQAGAEQLVWQEETGSIIAKNRDRAYQFLRNFIKTANKPHEVTFNVGKNEVIFDKVNESYTAVIQQTGDALSFNTAKEASDWAKGGWKTWEGLEQLAAQRGWRITSSGKSGAFTLYTKAEKPIIIRNKEDLIQQLEKFKAPDWLPDMFPPVSEAERKLMGKLPEMLPDTQLPKGKPPSVVGEIWTRGSKYVLTKRNSYSEAGRVYGDWKPMQLFEELMKNMRLSHAETRSYNNLLRQIFAPYQRKLAGYKRKQLQGLTYLVEAETPEQEAKVIEMYGLPEDASKTTKEMVRRLYDAMFHKYGIDPKTYIKNYVTHIIRAKTLEPKAYRDQMMLKDIFPSGLPKNLVSVFEIERMAETWEDLEDNIMYVMEQYGRSVIRTKFLGPTVEKIKTAVNQAPSDRKHVYRQLLVTLREALGMPMSALEADTKESFKILHRHLATNQSKVKAVIDAIGLDPFALSYLAFMPFRAWFAIRNLFQPYITLPPRGWKPGDILDAQHAFVTAGPDVIRELRDNGIIIERVPIGGGEALSKEGVIPWLTRKGMFLITHTDEINRGVSYLMVRQKMEAAAEKYGPTGDARFIEAVNLDRYDPFTRKDRASPVCCITAV